MNITIIGASGFVGTRLLGLLEENKAEYNLRNIDKQQSHFFPQITEIADVRNVEEIKAKLKAQEKTDRKRYLLFSWSKYKKTEKIKRDNSKKII